MLCITRSLAKEAIICQCGCCKKDFRSYVTAVCLVHLNIFHFAHQYGTKYFCRSSRAIAVMPTIKCLKLFMKWCQCDFILYNAVFLLFFKRILHYICRDIYSVVVRCDQMCTLKLIVGNED